MTTPETQQACALVFEALVANGKNLVESQDFANEIIKIYPAEGSKRMTGLAKSVGNAIGFLGRGTPKMYDLSKLCVVNGRLCRKS